MQQAVLILQVIALYESFQLDRLMQRVNEEEFSELWLSQLMGIIPCLYLTILMSSINKRLLRFFISPVALGVLLASAVTYELSFRCVRPITAYLLYGLGQRLGEDFSITLNCITKKIVSTLCNANQEYDPVETENSTRRNPNQKLSICTAIGQALNRITFAKFSRALSNSPIPCCRFFSRSNNALPPATVTHQEELSLSTVPTTS